MGTRVARPSPAARARHRADAASRVWEIAREFVIDERFSLYPDDDLGYVLGIAEEDLEDGLISKVCAELGLAAPTQALVDSVGRVDTPPTGCSID